jgi:hypothetical protein
MPGVTESNFQFPAFTTLDREPFSRSTVQTFRAAAPITGVVKAPDGALNAPPSPLEADPADLTTHTQPPHCYASPAALW